MKGIKFYEVFSSIIFSMSVTLGVLTGCGPSSEKMKEIKRGNAVKQLINLQTSLYAYNMTTGQYPTTSQGLEALLKCPVTKPIPTNWKGPYLTEKSIPLNPYGNKINYRYPAEKGKEYKGDAYSLWSDGPDGKPLY